jgi:hypothetical protein
VEREGAMVLVVEELNGERLRGGERQRERWGMGFFHHPISRIY